MSRVSSSVVAMLLAQLCQPAIGVDECLQLDRGIRGQDQRFRT